MRSDSLVYLGTATLSWVFVRCQETFAARCFCSGSRSGSLGAAVNNSDVIQKENNSNSNSDNKVNKQVLRKWFDAACNKLKPPRCESARVCLQFQFQAWGTLLLDWKVFCYKFNFSIIFILWATRAAGRGRAGSEVEWHNNNINSNEDDSSGSSITQNRIH